jgi:hypothetical protein
VSAQAADLLKSRGYVVLPRLLSPALCAQVVLELEADYGDGSRASKDDGHVIRDVGDISEAAREALSHPEVLGVAAAYLGGDVRVEATAGIVSDARRPFMPWHCHVGGIDQERLRPLLPTLQIDVPQRVMGLVYPGGCEGESGPLVVSPRRLGDPLGPPGDPKDPAWPGAIEIHAEPGTVVVADEALYHAVLPQRRPGLRVIVGAYWVRASVAGVAGHAG